MLSMVILYNLMGDPPSRKGQGGTWYGHQGGSCCGLVGDGVAIANQKTIMLRLLC